MSKNPSPKKMADGLLYALGRLGALVFVRESLHGPTKRQSSQKKAFWTKVYALLDDGPPDEKDKSARPTASRARKSVPKASGAPAGIQPGDIVYFGRPHGVKTRARVISVAKKTALVETLEARGKHASAGIRWRGPISGMSLASAGLPAVPARRPRSRRYWGETGPLG